MVPCAICCLHETPVAATTVSAGAARTAGNRELRRYRDAGTTDLIAHPVGTAAERLRTFEVLTGV